MPTLDSLIRQWDGLGVLCRHDAPTAAWIFICLHDDTLGAPTGGTRMAVYDAPADGLLDGMRLAEGMTSKWAAVGLPFGGGKAVLALSRTLAAAERAALLGRYGRLVEALRGGFRTGEDLGTTTADMQELARHTRHVHGFDGDGRKVDPSPFTARGVLSGIRAALEAAYGDAALRGRRVLVEGVGNVGRRLASELSADGARVLLVDLDEGRAAEVARQVGGEVVAAGQAHSVPCDVYAPCAIGATLTSETIPALSCRIIAGSANNQLGEPGDAERLRARGILYAPDFIVNAGGAVAFARLDQGAATVEEIFSEVERIGETTRAVLADAAARSETTLAAARRRVESTLARAASRS